MPDRKRPRPEPAAPPPISTLNADVLERIASMVPHSEEPGLSLINREFRALLADQSPVHQLIRQVQSTRPRQEKVAYLTRLHTVAAGGVANSPSGLAGVGMDAMRRLIEAQGACSSEHVRLLWGLMTEVGGRMPDLDRVIDRIGLLSLHAAIEARDSGLVEWLFGEVKLRFVGAASWRHILQDIIDRIHRAGGEHEALRQALRKSIQAARAVHT
jgi:hypothetical protein